MGPNLILCHETKALHRHQMLFPWKKGRKASSICHENHILHSTPDISVYICTPPKQPSLILQLWMTTYKVCFCFHRRYKPASSDPPEPIKGFYSKYSVNGFMGAEELQRFITEVQREARASREDVQAIIDSQREFRHLNLFKKGLSLDGFFRFLFAEENSPISHSLGVSSLFFLASTWNGCSLFYCEKKIMFYIKA